MNYFDLHSDTPYECYKKNVGMRQNGLAVSFDYARNFETWVQNFAIFIPDDSNSPYERYRCILKDFKKKIQSPPKNFKYIFSVEGGAVIEREISRLERLYKDGVKILSLTWNGENAIAGGINSNASLTRFGKNVIKRMNELSIVCDVSHLNQKSFYKAIDIAEMVIATHSNCRSVYNHPRNLTDEQLKLIAEKNGIIGVCFFPGFLGGDTFEMIYQNIYYMLSKGLEENIAIGSDFDGALMDSRLENSGDIRELYFRLSEKGLPDRVLDKCFYQNAAQFFRNL